jgi:kynurenine formamidase
MALPTYAELLARADAPPGSSWGLLGPAGTVARLTAERVKDAVGCVRDGKLFGLDWPLDAFNPPLAAWREIPRHVITEPHENGRDDYLDAFHMQASSQLDGLRHQRHGEHGFYNGVPDDAVRAGGGELGIEAWADSGIVGRGVLVDIERYLVQSRGHGLDHSAGEGYDVTVIDAALAFQGSAVCDGDIVLLRTGYSEYYFESLAGPGGPARAPGEALNINSAGVGQTEEAVRWIWDHGVSVLASDNIAVECLPTQPGNPFFQSDPWGMLHQPLIGLLGVALGELWRLGKLASACAADRRYEMMICAKPLYLIGGCGSPANAIAIR